MQFDGETCRLSAIEAKTLAGFAHKRKDSNMAYVLFDFEAGMAVATDG